MTTTDETVGNALSLLWRLSIIARDGAEHEPLFISRCFYHSLKNVMFSLGLTDIARYSLGVNQCSCEILNLFEVF